MKSVRAKKYLGQHFLKNKEIAREITELINNNSTLIVEIGPGMGALTEHLLKKKNPVKLVEIDNESILYLYEKFPETKNIIDNIDFLKLNIEDTYSQPISLIGNFPYNISSQILFKVLDNKDQITEIIGMFQMEVAERIASKKGRKRGILSVFIQAFYDVEYCFTINENEFFPIPKIKSGVIKCIRNKRQSLGCNEKTFKTIVKSAFNQRRKTLKNALKAFNLLNSEKLSNLLYLRAEELSVEDFIIITTHVKEK